MLNKVSNEKALSFIDSFLGKVTEKKAEESPITVKSSDIGGANLAGTVAAKVGGTTDTSNGKPNKEEKAKEGAHGKEKAADLSAAIPTTAADSSAAVNNESKDKERASTGDFGAEPTNDGGKDLAKEIMNSKAAEEQVMQNEMKRAENLGNKILQKVAASRQQPAPAAPAAQAPAKGNLIKQAADEAYHDFVLSYQYGLLKRAEDEAAIQQALGLQPEEASGMLDEVAAEDPNAVLPPEAMEGGAGGGAEEAGEPAAQELVEALQQLGISPEELEQAITEVDAEGGEGGPEAGAPAPAAGMEQMASEKQAGMMDGLEGAGETAMTAMKHPIDTAEAVWSEMSPEQKQMLLASAGLVGGAGAMYAAGKAGGPQVPDMQLTGKKASEQDLYKKAEQRTTLKEIVRGFRAANR
jgi:hypothetical protein